MATSHDVAAYILHRQGEMTVLKLQLLLYYSQAWSLVWDDQPLFDERIEARSHGPVVATLDPERRAPFRVSEWSQGDSDVLTPKQRETVDAVLNYYASKTGQWLGELARTEQPWLAARQLHVDISLLSMVEYYTAPY